MKKIIFIFILVMFHLISLAQSDLDRYDPFGSGHEGQETERDTVEKETVPHHRYFWKWMRNGVYPQEISLDTLQDGINNFNYIFKKSISNTYLGNFPSPYESNIFIDRNEAQDFYPLTFLRAYLYMPEDAIHINTTTPYTRLKYFTGGGKGKAENLVDVWHAQNILPYWNAGFRYHLISSDGRYANQKSKIATFSIFSSYEHERLVLSLLLSHNKGDIQENGGIRERYHVIDTTIKAENIQVWLNSNDVHNNFRNFNVNLQGQYNLGKPKEIINQSDTLYTYPAKAVINLHTQKNYRKFTEESINLEYYRNTYIDSTFSHDFNKSNIIDLSAKFVVNEHPKHKYLPGIFVGMDYYREKYNQSLTYSHDSIPGDKLPKKYTGTYITAGLFNVDTNTMLNYDVYGKIGVIGDYAGNFSVDGFITQALRKDKSSMLRADAKFELEDVHHFFKYYHGNHDQWDNDFKAMKTINVEGRYINTRLRTELGVGFTNLYSYTYLDSTIMPRQTDKTLVILTAWAKEVFRAGHFYFDQSVYFQQSNHKDILSLPTLSVFSHNYYQNYLFKNALQLQVGFDVLYNTAFYADDYMPSIMQFHRQKLYKTGNYPKVDVFMNLHIKRAQIFVKYEHVNFHIKQHGDFFSAANYPINPAMFKFGIQWDFFD